MRHLPQNILLVQTRHLKIKKYDKTIYIRSDKVIFFLVSPDICLISPRIYVVELIRRASLIHHNLFIALLLGSIS